MKERLMKRLEVLRKNQKGFTLIEMIVVIAIIGVLAAILVPAMSGYIKDAQETKRLASVRTFYTSAQAAVTSTMANGSSLTIPDSGEVIVTKKDEVAVPDDSKKTVAATICGKLKELMGETSMNTIANYAFKVDKDGAVTAITIKEKDSGTEITYPQGATAVALPSLTEK